MPKLYGRRRTMLAVLITITGVTAFLLGAVPGSTSADVENGGVRMAVDPTVLPPILPPGQKEEQVADEDGSRPQDEEAATAQSDDSVASPSKAEPNVSSKPQEKPRPKSVQKKGRGAIEDIDVVVADTSLTITVTCDRPVGATSYMNLDNPRRLVIDLRQPWVLEKKNVIRINRSGVKYVVLGEHPDRLRLVVHFLKPFRQRLAPQFSRQGNKLIVTANLP